MSDPCRVEKLINASDAAEATLLEYMKFRGKVEAPFIFAVEGHDDIAFLQTAVIRLNSAIDGLVAYFNCRGKSNVLALLGMIEESRSLSIEDIWFFVDRDFDDLRGHLPHAKLWMTPTYSFENLLVSERVLRKILEAEFRCHGADGVDESRRALAYYAAAMTSYSDVMRMPNLCLFHCVRRGIRTNPSDATITARITVDRGGVSIGLSIEDLLSAIPKTLVLAASDLAESEPDFALLDVHDRWRGKFLFQIFVKILNVLKHDRGTATPRIFGARANMTFNPSNDSIRSFTAIADLPNCLEEFLKSVGQPPIEVPDWGRFS